METEAEPLGVAAEAKSAESWLLGDSLGQPAEAIHVGHCRLNVWHAEED